MLFKIGIGYDIHRLVKGRKLFIGGIHIPYPKGLLGHSDADVLVHAICDALLGALGEDDIGQCFPDSNPKYHNICSIELLKIVRTLLKKKGFRVNNIDAAVIAEEPRLAPFKKQIRKKLAGALKIKEACINIKGKTSEGLDEVGKKKAIACYAVVMLMSR